jgi:hypothetical protein
MEIPDKSNLEFNVFEGIRAWENAESDRLGIERVGDPEILGHVDRFAPSAVKFPGGEYFRILDHECRAWIGLWFAPIYEFRGGETAWQKC